MAAAVSMVKKAGVGAPPPWEPPDDPLPPLLELPDDEPEPLVLEPPELPLLLCEPPELPDDAPPLLLELALLTLGVAPTSFDRRLVPEALTPATTK